MPGKVNSSVHVIIGDTQVSPGVPTAHLEWIGRFVVDQFYGRDDVTIVHLGDHFDMPSLSSYDRGKRAMEGRRYQDDIDAGNDAFDLLNEPLYRANRARRKAWRPARHFLLGNHEHRITRATEDNAQLEGSLSLTDLNPADWGWAVHPFLEPVVLSGVTYAHYLYHPNTGRPYSGENLHLRLKQVGYSFTTGHQQGMAYAVRPVGTTRHHGLVLGSTYLHEEEYLGPQATSYWRGIVVCYQVERGTYDPAFISLDYLCRRYEKKTLKEFMRG
jgi:hypothetical protein